jgi:hypothetical protein
MDIRLTMARAPRITHRIMSTVNDSGVMALDPSVSRLFADGVLVLHVALAAFVVAGLGVAVIGNLQHWKWVNNFWFRSAHLAAISIVAAEAWFGVACPLTTLEIWLRSSAGAPVYGGGFVDHWLRRLLYYDAPPWVFVLAYTLFACLVVATWWYFPPRRTRSVMNESPEVLR